MRPREHSSAVKRLMHASWCSVLVALPLGAVGLLVGHWAWRRRLIVVGG